MNRRNTSKIKIKEYKSHTITSKPKKLPIIFILGLKIII